MHTLLVSCRAVCSASEVCDQGERRAIFRSFRSAVRLHSWSSRCNVHTSVPCHRPVVSTSSSISFARAVEPFSQPMIIASAGGRVLAAGPASFSRSSCSRGGSGNVGAVLHLIRRRRWNQRCYHTYDDPHPAFLPASRFFLSFLFLSSCFYGRRALTFLALFFICFASGCGPSFLSKLLRGSPQVSRRGPRGHSPVAVRKVPPVV